jgi:hypothetical protein
MFAYELKFFSIFIFARQLIQTRAHRKYIFDKDEVNHE